MCAKDSRRRPDVRSIRHLIASRTLEPNPHQSNVILQIVVLFLRYRRHATEQEATISVKGRAQLRKVVIQKVVHVGRDDSNMIYSVTSRTSGDVQARKLEKFGCKGQQQLIQWRCKGCLIDAKTVLKHDPPDSSWHSRTAVSQSVSPGSFSPRKGSTLKLYSSEE